MTEFSVKGISGFTLVDDKKTKSIMHQDTVIIKGVPKTTTISQAVCIVWGYLYGSSKCIDDLRVFIEDRKL